MKLVWLVMAILMLTTIGWAGEKEELEWKGRALQAEFNIAQVRLGDTQKAIQDFLKELSDKGYEVKDGKIEKKVEKKAK